jgi:hypothetical protein
VPVDPNHKRAEPEPNSAAESITNAAASPDRPIARDIPCLKCGYNLRGLTTDRCPECGASIALARTRESFLPWLHRRRMGRLRAFWATVAVVLFRPQRLYAEFSRPADYESAQHFRWWAIAWTFPAIAVEMWSWWLTHWYHGEAMGWLHFLFELRWPVYAFPVLMFVLLAAGAALPSYFFHPRDLDVEKQNRAITLSYYTSAYLPALNVPSLIVGLAMTSSHHTEREIWLIRVANIMIVGVTLCWLIAVVVLMRRLMPDRPARAVAMAVLLPMLWLGAIVFIMLGLPTAIYYVQLPFISLS